MLRRVIFAVGAMFCLIPFSSGCKTREPVIYSEAHLKRHAMTLVDGFHYPTPFNPIPFDKVHADFDRIIYGLEEYPGEPWGEHTAREGKAFLHGFHRLHMDFDRIFLDMPEYPVESDY